MHLVVGIVYPIDWSYFSQQAGLETSVMSKKEGIVLITCCHSARLVFKDYKTKYISSLTENRVFLVPYSI